MNLSPPTRPASRPPKSPWGWSRAGQTVSSRSENNASFNINMKDEITIGTQTFAISKLELLQGYVDQSEVAYEKHKRGRNWVATVRFDPAAPNSLARAFWKRGSGSYVAVPASLAVGEVLEFGADYYSCGGNRHGRQIRTHAQHAGPTE